MEGRAEKSMFAFCQLLGESLDQPVLDYLARWLVESVKGTVTTEELLEQMQTYLAKHISLNNVRTLQEAMSAPEAVQTPKSGQKMQKTQDRETRQTSSLNAEAPAFEPRMLEIGGQEDSVTSDASGFIEGYSNNASSDPLEHLWSIFPDRDRAEIKRVYLAHSQNFEWTLNKLLMMKEGCTLGSRSKKDKRHDPGHFQAAPPVVDWTEDDFPTLPGQKTAAPSASERKTSFADIAKKKKPPAKEIVCSQTPSGRQGRVRSASDGAIPWVKTGEAVSKQYAELREAASVYAKLRNACFRNATKAYMEGRKGLAKDLGQNGRTYNDRMKECHYEASESIFRSRNQQLRCMLSESSPEALDLHGLHVAEAEQARPNGASAVSNKPHPYDISKALESSYAQTSHQDAKHLALISVLLLVLSVANGKRHLLEEKIAAAVEGFDFDNEDSETSGRLSRMLLAFHSLGKLKDEVALAMDTEWKKALLDHDKLDPVELKNFDYEKKAAKEEAQSHVAAAADAAASVVDSKKEFVSKLVDVATGELTFEKAAAGQIATLAKYLNSYIDKESHLLDIYGKGELEDQFSFRFEAPAKIRYIKDVLTPFGLLDETSILNVTASLQSKFCSPMAFLPRRSRSRRTIINGPAFELTLTTGECQMRLDFGDSLPFPTLPGANIKCKGPEVSYTKTPVSIHQQDVLPEAFASSECKLEREFGTAYEKVLYGGGPLIRFASVDELIDALVAKKYNLFGGLNALFEFDIKSESSSDKKEKLEEIVDFWSALGPGRLLKEKKIYGKALHKFSLPSLLDVAQTSPMGWGLQGEKLSPTSTVNLADRLFSMTKSSVLSKLKSKLYKD